MSRKQQQNSMKYMRCARVVKQKEEIRDTIPTTTYHNSEELKLNM